MTGFATLTGPTVIFSNCLFKRKLMPSRDSILSELAPIAESYVTEPVLTVIGGGSIAVTEDEDGRIVADIPVFKVSGILADEELLREERGVVRIKAKRRSAARAVWNSTLGILLRETDF